MACLRLCHPKDLVSEAPRLCTPFLSSLTTGKWNTRVCTVPSATLGSAFWPTGPRAAHTWELGTPGLVHRAGRGPRPKEAGPTQAGDKPPGGGA